MSTGRARLCTRTIALLVVLTLATACATSGTVPDIKPGERPAADTDEAGFWMMVDRFERELATSGAVVTDPGLNEYVRGIVCRLTPEQCAGIRVYVVETPYFNASMAPNGTLQVWTGLLLRTDNEAQLAYVLGHEIGHYMRRHTVQLWRDLRAKANAALVFSVLTAAAGVGPLGLLGQLAALGSVLAFSRDNEREADDIGLQLVVKAGYDPGDAARVWTALEEERKAAEKSRPFVFFATHPPTDERIETLRARAMKVGAGGAHERERFLEATAPHRFTWLRDEVRLREFKGTQVVLAHLREAGARPGEVSFFMGEMYRLRGEKDDASRAIAAYEEAVATGEAPAETHRALGLLWMKGDDRTRARTAFQRYLKARPDADDREVIHAYLRQLE